MWALVLLGLPLSPHGVNDAFACAAKTGALEQAQAVLQGRHEDRVAEALDFQGCPKPRMQGAATTRSAVGSGPGAQLHVAPVIGDDRGPGTAAAPLRSLHEAQRRLRAMPTAKRAGTRVVLGDGTHFLEESLVFTEADSGSAAAPVVWTAGAAVVSGGRALDCQGKWRQTQGGVYECTVPRGLSFDSLFVGGLRQTRARFPNGSPLEPRSGYARGCKALTWWKDGEALPKNLRVLASDGKTEISELCAQAGQNVTVKDTVRARTVSNCKVDQVQYRGTRFNETFNYPYWLFPVPASIELAPAFQGRKWSSPEGAVVKMMHPKGWGSWCFEIARHDVATHALNFSRGGFQEARGIPAPGEDCGAMYVENLSEELDAEGEWFLDARQGALRFIPPAGWSEADLQQAEVVAPQLPRLFQFRGSADSPVHDIVLEGFNLTHAAPTYLDSYEAPSGGDWSIHRGGAVFLDGAEHVALRSLVFDQVDGNGVFLSNHAVSNVVQDCDFWRTGDTAVAVLGSVPLGDARKGSGAVWPVGNTIQGNWIEEVGVHMKQTSCVFRSLAEGTTIRGNVCYNGPRAGINCNDGFRGGDVIQGNVIFNMVRETGDHGNFNSWDRREFIFDCSDGEGVCFTPSTTHVRHNIFLGPAGYNVDHDDGSSHYEDFSNVVYLGGFKYRDGVMRNMTGNLLIEASPVFQATGFDTNYWVDNTIVSKGFDKICAPESTAALTGTTYAVLAASDASTLSIDPTRSFDPGMIAPPQKCDKGIQTRITAAQLARMIRNTLALPEATSSPAQIMI